MSSSRQTIQYDALKGSASWSIKFTAPTEVTGGARLHLRFAVDDGASDADLFVTLQSWIELEKWYFSHIIHSSTMAMLHTGGFELRIAV